MSQIRVIVVSPEEAYDGAAEFWCGGELMGSRCSRRPGRNCASTRAPITGRGIDTTSLAQGPDDANRLIAAY